MSLQTFFGRLNKTLAVKPATKAGNRKMIVRAALSLGHSELSDEEARTQLRSDVLVQTRGARAALKSLSTSRDEYEGDRAYRLLEAAIADVPVRPIDSEVKELFEREAELGHLSVSQAISRLEELEPALTKLLAKPSGQSLSRFLGPGAQHPDPLVRSHLALSIAHHFLSILSGSKEFGDLSTSYFRAPRRLVVRTGSIHGGLPEPPANFIS